MTLDKEELDILESFERGEWQPISEKESELIPIFPAVERRVTAINLKIYTFIINKIPCTLVT